MSIFDLVQRVGRKPIPSESPAPAEPPVSQPTPISSVVMAAASVIATLRKDWLKVIQIIDSKIAAARAELEAVEAQRQALAFDAYGEGEAKGGATAKLKTANADCDRLQRTIDDLQAARAEAVKRQEGDEAEAERAAEAKRRAEARAAHAKMMAAIEKSEKAIDDAAVALAAARDAKNEFCRAWPPKHFDDVIFGAWDAVNPCIRFKLREFGMKPPMMMTAGQANWVAYFPGLARLGLDQD